MNQYQKHKEGESWEIQILLVSKTNNQSKDREF